MGLMCLSELLTIALSREAPDQPPRGNSCMWAGQVSQAKLRKDQELGDPSSCSAPSLLLPSQTTLPTLSINSFIFAPSSPIPYSWGTFLASQE